MKMIKTKKVNGRLVAVGVRKANKREEKKGKEMVQIMAEELRKFFMQ